MGHSRADVVATAVRVLDTHGLEHCSMRRVAAELDVQPSALYHHVANKQRLLELMADHIIAAAKLPALDNGTGADQRDSAGDCAPRTRELSRAVRAALLSVRDGAEVVATATVYQMGESPLQAHFARLIGADAARTLLLFLFGHAQSTQLRLQAQQFGLIPVTLSREQLDAECERGVNVIIAGCDTP